MLGPVAAQGVEYGDYYLIGRLARGGMAEVFLAKSLFGDRERLLALKRTLSEYSEEDDFISMFTDEARIASGLTHPNICHILDHGEVGDQRFLVMEFIHGKDLKVVAHRARQRGELVPTELVAFILARIASALHEAHTKRNSKGEPENIVHRDISPQNILISYEGQPKLIDFGIAKAKDRLSKTQAGVVKGKFAYMSPEQAIGGDVDARTDIFALGVVLYELVVGTLPFKGSSDFSTLKRVARAEYEPPPTDRVPARLVKVIQKALTRSPDERYATAADFARDLDLFLTDLGKEVQPAQLSSYMRKLFRDDYIREMSRIKAYRAVEPPKVSRPPATKIVPAISADEGDDKTTRRTTSPQPMPADEHTKDTRNLMEHAAKARAKAHVPSPDEEATRITSSAELAAGFAGDDDDDEVTGLAELLEPGLNEDTLDTDEATRVSVSPFEIERESAAQHESMDVDFEDDEPTNMTELPFSESTREVPAPFVAEPAADALGAEPSAQLAELIDAEAAEPEPGNPVVDFDDAIDIDDGFDMEPVAPALAPTPAPASAPASAQSRSGRTARARRGTGAGLGGRRATGGAAVARGSTAAKSAKSKTSTRRRTPQRRTVGVLTGGEKIALGVVAALGVMLLFSTYYVTRVGVPPFAAALEPSLEKITGALPVHPDALQPAPAPQFEGAEAPSVNPGPETAAADAGGAPEPEQGVEDEAKKKHAPVKQGRRRR